MDSTFDSSELPKMLLTPADLPVAGWEFEAVGVTVASRALEPLCPRGLEKPRGTELIKEPNHAVGALGMGNCA